MDVRTMSCPRCGGTTIDPERVEPKDCPACAGDGYIAQGFGPPCSRCEGTGSVVEPTECVACAGFGEVAWEPDTVQA